MLILRILLLKKENKYDSFGFEPSQYITASTGHRIDLIVFGATY